MVSSNGRHSRGRRTQKIISIVIRQTFGMDYRELKKATFGKYIEGWKTTYLIPGTIDENGNLTAKRLNPSTIRGYRTIIDGYLKPEFEHIPLQAIDAGKIKALESKLLQRPKFSNKSVHNALTLLGRILDDARIDGYLKVSPMIDVEKTKFVCKKGRALRYEASMVTAKPANDGHRKTGQRMTRSGRSCFYSFRHRTDNSEF